MKVTVELSGQLKQAIGVSEVEMTLNDPSTTKDLIEQLQNEFPEAMSNYALDSNGQLLSSLLFVLNDKQVRAIEPIRLNEGDIAALLSPISGG